MNHLCFSGEPACSGCNPCQACAKIVHERVLPGAAVAAGLDGSLLALVHVFAQSLHRVGIDPANLAQAHAGVPLSAVFGTAEAQAEAFVAGYQGAWGLLIRNMLADPTLGGRANTRLVSTPIAAAVDVSPPQATAPVPTVEAPRTPPPPSVDVPQAAPPPVMPIGPGAQPIENPTTAAYEAYVAQKNAPLPAPPPMTAPMDAEDIAAAALPAPESVNGIAVES